MPSSRAMYAAVSGWSPVIITGGCPRFAQRATAVARFGRAGSIIPIRPTKNQVLFQVIVDPAGGCRPCVPKGYPRTRHPILAMAVIGRQDSLAPGASSGSALIPDPDSRQTSSKLSTAPLVKARVAEVHPDARGKRLAGGRHCRGAAYVGPARGPWSCACVPSRRAARRPAEGCVPARFCPDPRRAAAMTSALSVGSPRTARSPLGCPLRSITASLHRRRGCQQRASTRRRLVRAAREAASSAIRQCEITAGDLQHRDRHAVLGQGAGLVRANHRD